MEYFKHFPGEHTPRTPLKTFLFFNLLQLTQLKKNTLEKKWWNYAPPSSKFLATPLHRPWTINTIFATLFCYLGSEFRQNCRQKHPPVKIFYFAHWSIANQCICQNAISSSRESNPSRRICHQHAVPLGHVAKLKVLVQTIFILHQTARRIRRCRSAFKFQETAETCLKSTLQATVQSTPKTDCRQKPTNAAFGKAMVA